MRRKMRVSLEQMIYRAGQCGRAISRKGALATSALVLFFLLISQAIGQLATADILGTVTDATGAVIPNANIALTNLATGETRNAKTSSSGDYTFTLLPVGHYSVSVGAPRFQTAETKDLAVEAGDRARNDVRLNTGSVATTVEVEAVTPLLQADNATVSSTILKAR
jgi:Carboxypeptidase regulatory-like domain